MSLEIQKELLAIKRSDDLLRVDDVIDWAKKNTTSALHKQYDWDVKRAAREHWRETTRRLIALHITYEDGSRKFVSLSIDRSRPGGGYRDVDEVRETPGLMEIMLDDALREVERVRLKFERVKALAPLWKAAAKIRARRPAGKAEARASK